MHETRAPAPAPEPSPSPPTPAASGWRRRRLIRMGLPVVAIAVIAGIIFLLSRPGGSTDSAELREAKLGALAAGAPQVGQPAPDFALRSLDGSVVRLSDLRGKTVLLNFWATWCGPCRAEMPDIQSVYAQHQGDFVVLAVNSEGTGADMARQLAGNFRDELGLTFPVLLDSPDGEVLRQYKLKGMPDSFFIDRNGIIRDISLGPMNHETILKKLQAAEQPGS